MTTKTRTDDGIRGKTIRWTFDDGPTRGASFEHAFGRDGSVTYRMLEAGKTSPGGGDSADYGSARISDEVSVASYRSSNGWTLTVALDFANGRLVAYASNDQQWFEQRGTFEVVG